MKKILFELPISAHLRQQEQRIFPGVRGKANANIHVRKNDEKSPAVIIPKGSNIIIQPLEVMDTNASDSNFKITCFEADTSAANNNLPENQRDITIGESYFVKIDNPKQAFLFEEQYQRSNKPLFSSDSSPSLADIKQRQIPDCFLLASIQAILNHPDGAAFIRGMMRQNEDGTTTVRLFDPETQQPRYFRINTAVLINQQGGLNKHKELWVHVLESAYAAMGKCLNTDEYTTTGKFTNTNVDSSASSVFNHGGFSAFAISILTGLNASHIPPDQDSFCFLDCSAKQFEQLSCFNHKESSSVLSDYQLDNQMIRIFSLQLDEIINIESDLDIKEMYQLRLMQENAPQENCLEVKIQDDRIVYRVVSPSGKVKNGKIRLDALGLTSGQSLTLDTLQIKLPNILGITYIRKHTNPSERVKSALEKYKIYLKFYTKNKNVCDHILTQPYDNARKLREITSLVNSTDNEKVFNFLNNALNHYTVKPFAEKTVRLDALAFSGVYSIKQNQRYIAIQSALNAGELVITSSLKTFETKVLGLVENHAYTVLDVKERNVTVFDSLLQKDKVIAVRYVQLRNPWGTHGRNYMQNEGALEFIPIEDKNSAIFEIELSDFVQYFSFITTSESANTLFASDKLRLHTINSIEKTLDNCHINTSSTLNDLCVFQRNYNDYEKKLINLEKLTLNRISSDLTQEIEAIFSAQNDLFIEESQIRYLLRGSLTSLLDDNAQKKTLKQYYRLLKLQYLEKQEDLAYHQILCLKTAIIENSQYDFCPIMANEKTKMMIMLNSYQNDCLQKIDTLASDLAKLELKNICIEEIIALNADYMRIITMIESLSELGIYLELDSILLLKTHLHEIDLLVNHCDTELKTYEEQVCMVMLEAANFYKQGQISLTEYERLSTIAKEKNLDLIAQNTLNHLADRLQSSDDTHRQTLGNHMKVFVVILDALHRYKKQLINAFQAIWNLIKSVLNIQEDKNSYDLPAYLEEHRMH